MLGRRTRAVRTHLRLVPRGDGVIPVSNNRIERYHSEIAPKIRSTQGVKNLELRNYFQFYNLRNFFRKSGWKQILDQLASSA